MSFQGLTPESLIQRNDSKNPATTCKGITGAGRPCRRALASTPGTSPAPSPGNSPSKGGDGNGVVAILNEGDAAAFFCWQHKDQAENLVAKMKRDRQKTRIMPLQKRSSIDTLAEKVGVLDLDAEVGQASKHRPHLPGRHPPGHKIKKRDTLPQEWQKINGPLMSVPEDVVQEAINDRPRPPRRRSSPKKYERYGKSNVKASWACCIRADDDYNDDGPPARRKERYDQARPSSQTRPTGQAMSYNSQATGNTQIQQQTPPRRPLQNTTSQQSHLLTPTRPSPRPSPHHSPPHSQTQSYLSLIPPHLDPQTTSALLTELSKPFAKDDEAGYIYIFWLTPTTEDSTPDDDIASTILDGDLDYQDDSFPTQTRRSLNAPSQPSARSRAQALNRYASVKHTARTPPKILLKIGRAQNVHRRMTQWTKQCNQNITLVRYYPHYASEAASPNSPGGSKMPHVNRVEKLIHLELRGLGMGREVEKCGDCGREHREWFEVTGDRAGLRGVDEVVKRWVGWAEDVGREEERSGRQET